MVEARGLPVAARPGKLGTSRGGGWQQTPSRVLRAEQGVTSASICMQVSQEAADPRKHKLLK